MEQQKPLKTIEIQLSRTLVDDDADTLRSQDDLRREFLDEEYRYSYAEDLLNSWVATQIVVLREQRGLSQKDLAELIGTKQPGISRLEDVNHSTWKTETLKRIARALGVRLKISFETFGTLLEEDEGFSRESLRRPRFEEDPLLASRGDTIHQTGQTVTRGEKTYSDVQCFDQQGTLPPRIGPDKETGTEIDEVRRWVMN